MLRSMLPKILLVLLAMPAQAAQGWGCRGSDCDEGALNDIINEAQTSFNNSAFTYHGKPAAARLETLALRMSKAIARISLTGEDFASGTNLVLEYDASAQKGLVFDGIVSGLMDLSTPTYVGVVGGAELDVELIERLAKELELSFKRAADLIIMH